MIMRLRGHHFTERRPEMLTVRDPTRSSRPRAGHLRAIAAALAAGSLLLGNTLTAGASMAPSRMVSAKSAAASSTFTFGREGSLLTRSFNPYNPNWVSYLNNVALMQLAFAHPLSLTQYYPELAKQISVKGEHITVTLQNADEWTDNTPVTSRDVLTAFYIDGIGGGNPVWSELRNVTTPNTHQIIFTLQPGRLPDQILNQIFFIMPVPASQYAHLLPANIKSELLKDYALYNTSPSAAASSAVGKTLSSLDTTIVDYVPNKFFSDGPYQLVSSNTSEILLHKWQGFWDAKMFKISDMKFIVLGANNDLYPAMLSNDFDETLVGMPKLIVQEALTNSHIRLFKNGDGITTKALIFNSNQYPFTILKVRQALSMMISRPAITADVWGTFPNGVGGAEALQVPSPVPPSILSLYLTRNQIASLNPYNYSVAQATSMLESVGFKDTSSGWIMPNGQLFSFSVMAPSGWSGPDLASVYLGSLFSGLGIHVSAYQPPYATFSSDLNGGTFDTALFWTSCCLITNPLDELELPLANAATSFGGSGSTAPGIGIPATATIPGIGTVNVADAIRTEADSVPVGTPKFKQLVYDWVSWFNANDWAYNIEVQTAFSAYDTVRFTNWPPLNSPYNRVAAQGSQGQQILAMQEGYITPR